MTKRLIIALLIANCTLPIANSFAQTLSPKATPTCGGYATCGGNSLSFTIGETFNTTLQNGNVLLTQGQQQPYITLRILNLKAFIEGYYLAGISEMQPVLLNGGAGADPLVCDSIIVELHDQLSPSTIVASQTVALHTNGMAQLTLPGNIMGASFYITIRTRNAVETWSKLPVTLGTNTSFDFTQ